MELSVAQNAALVLSETAGSTDARRREKLARLAEQHPPPPNTTQRALSAYPRMKGQEMNIASSSEIVKQAIEQFSPTHIVSMVSGGKDSAASDQVARELGLKIDFVIHGNTRCGIPETTEFVRDVYGRKGEYVEADAGTAYEDYVLRKGFPHSAETF